MSGPSWIGVGAQRCGTTWFADLLAQHPAVALARDGRKEVHFFDRYLVEPWSDADVAQYAALFDPSVRAGEFTPSYLRSFWVPDLVHRACGHDVVLVVLLRDPVERFASAMRWYATRPGVPKPDRRNEYFNWVRDKGHDAEWAGMYATHLSVWERVFPRDRFVVIQHEAAQADPQTAAGRVWRALGLEPVTVRVAAERSWNSTAATTPMPWADLAGLREALLCAYEPEVAAIERRWTIDRSLWPHFA
jgi:hypothetical protein